MKKRITILMTTLLLTISVLSGCGAESTTTEPTETATATTTEESTTEQAEEATATSEETAEPTPEVKEEPSEETTEATSEPTETPEPEPTEEPTPETEPQATYTYTDMSATMYAQQTVNVRDLPDTHGNKIGSLSTNDEIKISGKCNETGWYMFEYNGSVAYVSNKYVDENKVEVQQQAPADNSTADTGNASTSGNYEKNVWYDMGEYYFIMCNSQEEADNYYMSCFDNHDDYNIRATLQSRYPDRHTYVMGRPNYVTLVVAVYPTAEGFPNWSTITNYVPEVSMR